MSPRNKSISAWETPDQSTAASNGISVGRGKVLYRYAMTAARAATQASNKLRWCSYFQQTRRTIGLPNSACHSCRRSKSISQGPVLPGSITSTLLKSDSSTALTTCISLPCPSSDSVYNPPPHVTHTLRIMSSRVHPHRVE